MFRTQTGFVRPLIYVPVTTGCLPGRGETVISMDGFSWANADRRDLMNAL